MIRVNKRKPAQETKIADLQFREIFREIEKSQSFEHSLKVQILKKR